MKILEKELEDAIYDATDKQLCQHGLSDIVEEGILRRFRQTNLGEEAGRSDLIFVTRKHFSNNMRHDSLLRINIIELKREKFGCEALLQAIRYAYAIQSYMSHRKFKQYDIKVIVIGEAFEETNNFMFLPHVINRKPQYGFGEINEISVYSFGFAIGGFNFVKSGIGIEKTKTDLYMEEILCKKDKKKEMATQQNQNEQDGLPF